MINNYKSKFGIKYVRCLNCDYIYDTFTGDFDIEIDAITLAEKLHQDNPKQCKKSCLVIEIINYYLQIEEK